jgi:hypothetical protein
MIVSTPDEDAGIPGVAQARTWAAQKQAQIRLAYRGAQWQRGLVFIQRTREEGAGRGLAYVQAFERLQERAYEPLFRALMHAQLAFERQEFQSVIWHLEEVRAGDGVAEHSYRLAALGVDGAVALLRNDVAAFERTNARYARVIGRRERLQHMVIGVLEVGDFFERARARLGRAGEVDSPLLALCRSALQAPPALVAVTEPADRDRQFAGWLETMVEQTQAPGMSASRTTPFEYSAAAMDVLMSRTPTLQLASFDPGPALGRAAVERTALALIADGEGGWDPPKDEKTTVGLHVALDVTPRPSDRPRTRGDDGLRLAVSVPTAVRRAQPFSVRFAAYIAPLEDRIREQFAKLGRLDANTALDLARCHWRRDTPVSVRISGEGIKVRPRKVDFRWNGESYVTGFSVSVVGPYDGASAISLFLDVRARGVPQALIPVDIALRKQRSFRRSRVASPAYNSAFASHSKHDIKRVHDMVSSYENMGMDVYMHAVEGRQGEDWWKRIQNEIVARDLFLLFWSANARHSREVRHEYLFALQRKGTAAIRIHALEDIHSAPPPRELKHLQFGDVHQKLRGPHKAPRTTKGGRLQPARSYARRSRPASGASM